MSNVYGSNYNKEFLSSPKQFAEIGEYNGKVRFIYDTFAGAAGGDDVYFGKLPANARILRLGGGGLGTAPVFSHAAMDKLTSKEDLVVTLDGDASASGYVFAEYVTE
jgi:hypothetical protein